MSGHSDGIAGLVPVFCPLMSVTQILSAIEHGDPQAAELLLPIVYEELRKLAAAKLAQEKPGQTLQATALVHEAYLRLMDARNEPQWDNRGHFFAAAAEAMRRILVEEARRKGRIKRGADFEKRGLDTIQPATELANLEEVLALEEALVEFARERPEMARLVNLRYFAGLSIPQAASAMGISASTADRHWRYARAWLFRRLR